MKNILYIAPRQSSKTSSLLYEFYKSPEDTAVILFNRAQIKGFKDKGHDIKNFIGMHDLAATFRGYDFKKVLVDEYFEMNTKENKALEEYACITGSEIIAFGTPNKQYDTELVKCITGLRKTLANTVITSSYIIRSVDYKSIERDFNCNEDTIQYLFSSLLTKPDTRIIQNTWYKTNKISGLHLHLTPEQYELEVEAKYLK